MTFVEKITEEKYNVSIEEIAMNLYWNVKFKKENRRENMSNIKSKIQGFGGFLTAMILPCIGAFIAWGFLTALFIPNGWIPNEHFALLKTPIVNYLLPMLIAYNGGEKIHGKRGGVIGALVTMGACVGAEIPMFIGAMVMGPLSAWILKKFDQAIDGKIPSGFEMLVNNFSLGLIGLVLLLLTYSMVGPMFETMNMFFANGVKFLVKKGLLILVPIFMEPARLLFLNNAISQGIFNPLGIQDAAQAGKSIFFMLSSNPGPGLGMLIAYWFFGTGTARESAPSAMIIHFFGGIHEIYFPYVLMKPKLIIGTIAGWMSATIVYTTLPDAGLVAYPSPGSVISYLIMTPKGGYITTLAGIFVATLVSFVICALLLKTDKKIVTEEDFQASINKMEEFKGKKSKVYNKAEQQKEIEEQTTEENQNPYKNVKLIVFACDAGMGSSAMGASLLQKKILSAGFSEIKVVHRAIESIPADEADIIICQEGLYDRARKVAPNNFFITIGNFINAPEYEELIEDLKKANL